jgi:hypothetical protein
MEKARARYNSNVIANSRWAPGAMKFDIREMMTECNLSGELVR